MIDVQEGALLPRYPDCPESVHNLVCRCLEPEPAKRPKAAALKKLVRATPGGQARRPAPVKANKAGGGMIQSPSNDAGYMFQAHGGKIDRAEFENPLT